MSTVPLHAAFISRVDCPNIDRIFDAPRRERVARHAQVLPVDLTPANLADHLQEAAQIEAVFGTWDIPANLLTPDRFPALKIVCYGAGTVKGFGRPLPSGA